MKIAVYGGGIYLLLNLYAFLVSDKLLFVPQAPSYAQLPSQVKIAVSNGEKINAVFLEHPDAPFTFLFSHGNAEDLGNVVPFMQQFYDLGCSVLMYDYRGYGTSEGTPSYWNVLEDADAAYHWLVQEKHIEPETIIAHGRSLGGAVAVRIAANHKVGGLVVESSFASALRVKTRWPLLPWDKFNSVKSMREVHCPVLIMHGIDDEIIPYWHGQKLFESAPQPKHHLWIKNGQHNDYAYAAGDDYLKAIQSFLETVSKYQSTKAE